jgi:hypothetical protein
MLETIAEFVGNIAIYIAALLGLIALYFFWVAFREWRLGHRAAFGIERDIASSEMFGALAKAVVIVVIGLLVVALGQMGQESEPTEQTQVQPTQPAVSTISVFDTATPPAGSPAPTLIPTDTPLPELTDIPPLPSEATEESPAEPATQTARVTVVGGLWLRDAPNGGTIEVLPEQTIVEFLEGREAAGNFEWQKVRVLNTPPGSEGLVDQEGWVAFSPDFLEVSP